MLLNWAQARKAFVLRAVATAAGAAAAHEAEVVLADSRQKQLEICADLKAKVCLVINPSPNLHLTDTFKMKFFRLTLICFQINNGNLSALLFIFKNAF